MNCSSSLKLMGLSSTINTLMGGTFPSSRPACCSFGGGGGSPLMVFVLVACDWPLGPCFFFLVERPGSGELVLLGGVMLGL